ncbi:MAG: recombinase family protein [Bryobacteraceae bacterium]|jgi:DNA invertase Pin-like site-specific DNA recombinase
MIVAVYARVSTQDQNCEIQLADLHRHASIMQWPVIDYVDRAWGKEGSRRPVLDRLLTDARARKFEAVLAWKADRFGRSVVDFIRNVQDLARVGVRLIVISQGIETNERSPMGKLLLRFLSVLAQLERDLIWEITTHGLAEYRRAYVAGEIGKRRHSHSGKDLPAGGQRREFDRLKALEMRKHGASI